MSNHKDRIIYLKGIQMEAKYEEQIVPAYKGNPFIEAIPPRLSQEQLENRLFSMPRFTGDVSQLNDEERIEMVQQIKPGYWQPLTLHFERYRNLYNMIKIGYQSRNPLTPIYQRQFAIGLDKILTGGRDEKGRNIAGHIQTAQQMADIGLSGIGKSKSYERILGLMPQVIHHTEYENEPLPCKQVIWLKIECPSNKSVGALCRNFYWAVDELLGTTYYEDLAERDGRAEVLAKRMSKVAGLINLGVLVIDEIQRINRGHSGGDEKMIDFITELTNSIGIPIVLIGTFKALYLFKTSLANSRRGIPDGFTENIIDRMKDDWEWDLFLGGLWDLQYTNKFTPLTSALKDAMYYHTIGIPDFAVKLFMHVQCHAILYEEDETISVEIIESVANKTLRLVQPIFERIRNEENIDPSEYEDLRPDWISFKQYLIDAQHRITIEGQLSEEHKRIVVQRNRRILLDQLIGFAMKMGCKAEEARVYAERITLDNQEVGDDVELLYSELAKLVLGTESSVPKGREVYEQKKEKKYKRLQKVSLESCDIRSIVLAEQGKTMDEALNDAGLVGEFDEFV
ncbi:hypothetical protein J2T18_004212 [Paenibacillus polymyxa]|uniref:ATP-binding protein n=1 Tax=Paenibacillus polymyxa TaxID=1406 RepID=UPI00278D85D3|nr:ATP-binding protein [Paenibacillus polymyxa]MDQ0049890.1 hypothetical protein [Paenibacillus polymyxa]